MKDQLWEAIQNEVRIQADEEPALSSFLYATVLVHTRFEYSLSYLLAQRVASSDVNIPSTRELIEAVLLEDPGIGYSARNDIKAYFERDSACAQYCLPLLYYKGFHALQCHRVAFWLWKRGRKQLAYFLQSQSALNFGVDIHPAARIGCGVMLDHATGIVIGETAVVEDDVSIMQSVTLGGTGKVQGDRHPKIRRGATIHAGTEVLGNIEIGEGAMVGAGSVVLKPVESYTTVVGVPAVRVDFADEDCSNSIDINSAANKEGMLPARVV